MLIGIIFAILPGAVLLKAARFSVQDSILFAFPISIAIYAIAGIITFQIGVSGFAALMGTSALITLLIAAIIILAKLIENKVTKSEETPSQNTRPHRLSIAKDEISSRQEWIQLAVYMCVNMVIMFGTYIMLLDSPEAVFTFGDNTFHVSVIKSMIDSGNYSTFSVTEYPDTLPTTQIPFDKTASYYPAAYHVFAAIISAPFNALVPIAENSLNYIIVAIFFPLGVLALLRQIFDNKWIIIAGSFTICACVAFPLRPLIIHQIYPNLAAFACLPSTSALFIRTFDLKSRSNRRIVCFFSFIASSIGVGLLHPNAVIALGVTAFCILIAYSFPNLIYQTQLSIAKKRSLVLFECFILTALFSAVWLFLFNHPALSGITSYLWDWTIDPASALLSCLTLGLKLMSPNFMLAVLMFVGLIYCLKHLQYTWIVLNAFLFFVLYFFNAIGGPEIKQLFSGFWYTDPERTSALVAIAIIPITACGLYCLIKFVILRVQHIKDYGHHPLHAKSSESKKTQNVIAMICIFIFIALNYVPNFIPIPIKGIGDQASFYVTLNQIFREGNPKKDIVYSKDERDFIKEVSNLVGDELVINMPYDGSVYTYAFDDLNVFYKSNVDSADTVSSYLIRTGLSSLKTNDDVASAVKDTGAKYVLVLHQDPESNDDRNRWNPNDWIGIDSITNETPGFEVILSEGNLRLYKIV